MKKSNNKLVGIISVVALFALVVIAGTYPNWRPVDANGTFTGTAKGMCQQ